MPIDSLAKRQKTQPHFSANVFEEISSESMEKILAFLKKNDRFCLYIAQPNSFQKAKRLTNLCTSIRESDYIVNTYGIKFCAMVLRINRLAPSLSLCLKISWSNRKLLDAHPFFKKLIIRRESMDPSINLKDSCTLLQEAKLTDLTSLTLSGWPNMTPLIPWLNKEMPSLKSLSLRSCNITDEDLYLLFKFSAEKKLTKLDLGQNHITDEGCAQIARYTPQTLLETLSLADNKIRSVDSVILIILAVIGRSALTTLDMHGNIPLNNRRYYKPTYQADEDLKIIFDNPLRV
jgi:hypothetical protein